MARTGSDDAHADDRAGQTTPDTIQSVDRAIQILGLLGDRSPLGVSEVSRELGVHRSTAFRLLATLVHHGLVEQEGHRGQYRLGLGLLELAGSVTHRADLVQEAQIVCDAMAARLQETVNVAILDERATVTVTQTMSSQMVAVQRQYVGQRMPLHATSTGKVLLAGSPPTLRESILAAPLARITPATITDAALLRRELDTVREQGWAGADAEWETDANAVAVPILGPGGDVVAALSATAPRFRMPASDFARIAAVLHDGARDLSRRLGHRPGAA